MKPTDKSVRKVRRRLDYGEAWFGYASRTLLKQALKQATSRKGREHNASRRAS